MYKNILTFKNGNSSIRITINDIVTLSEYLALLLEENIAFNLELERQTSMDKDIPAILKPQA